MHQYYQSNNVTSKDGSVFLFADDTEGLLLVMEFFYTVVLKVPLGRKVENVQTLHIVALTSFTLFTITLIPTLNFKYLGRQQK